MNEDGHEYAIKVLENKKQEVVKTLEHIAATRIGATADNASDYYNCKRIIEKLNDTIFTLQNI